MKIRLRDGTGVLALRYLVEDTDRHGNVRVYFRREGRKVRLQATPGTDEFFEEYRAALNGTPLEKSAAVAHGSLRWLFEQYMASEEFKQLNNSTKRTRRGIIDSISEKHGTKPYAMMEMRHAKSIRDEKGGLPEAANGRVRVLRSVFKWAIGDNKADRNPARDCPYVGGNGDGYHTWTVEEVRQYEKRHPLGTKANLALALMLYTGARRSDAVKLGKQMEKAGKLKFRETKGARRTVKERELPIVPQLRRAIDATPSGHLTYLVTEFGKPFTPAGFGNWFRKRCNEAGLKHCSAHGLRKAGATIAAENGATDRQLMAIFGWQTAKQATVYTRQADRTKLAADAMHLLVPSVPPQKAVRQSGR